MKKPIFYTEAAYVAGIFLLAFGTALTEYGGWGISMVVAPAYILYLKVSQFLPFFTFGMAEYALQALILGLMMVLVGKIKPVWLFSFVTTVLYGLLLDGSGLITELLPQDPAVKLTVYVAGVLLCSAGLSLLFRTYFPPSAYEMFVKYISAKWHIPLHIFKTVYDCCSCVISIGLSLLLLGDLRGIGIGTVVYALTGGTLIRLFTRIFDRFWSFSHGLTIKKYFIESEETL